MKHWAWTNLEFRREKSAVGFCEQTRTPSCKAVGLPCTERLGQVWRPDLEGFPPQMRSPKGALETNWRICRPGWGHRDKRTPPRTHANVYRCIAAQNHQSKNRPQPHCLWCMFYLCINWFAWKWFVGHDHECLAITLWFVQRRWWMWRWLKTPTRMKALEDAVEWYGPRTHEKMRQYTFKLS